MKGSRADAVRLFAALLLPAFAARAQVTLPQFRRTVTVAPETVRAVQAGLAAAASTIQLSRSDEELLLKGLPDDLRDSCGAMIEHWGEIARGSAEWKVRVLYREDDRLWLAFQCGSRAPEYKDDYDERPALLRLGAGKLEFFPPAIDSANDSTLFHINFAGTVPLDGVLAAAFKVTEAAENPCCGGPESRSGEKWIVFADMRSGVTELLTIVTARDDSSHSDDPEVDTETTYRAELQLERDQSGRVTAVTASFREETKEFSGEFEAAPPRIVSKRSGTLRYRWSPELKRFEEMK